MNSTKDIVKLNFKKIKLYGDYRRYAFDSKTHRLKIKGFQKMYHANSNHKTARMVILIPDH